MHGSISGSSGVRWTLRFAVCKKTNFQEGEGGDAKTGVVVTSCGRDWRQAGLVELWHEALLESWSVNPQRLTGYQSPGNRIEQVTQHLGTSRLGALAAISSNNMHAVHSKRPAMSCHPTCQLTDNLGVLTGRRGTKSHTIPTHCHAYVAHSSPHMLAK